MEMVCDHESDIQIFRRYSFLAGEFYRFSKTIRCYNLCSCGGFLCHRLRNPLRPLPVPFPAPSLLFLLLLFLPLEYEFSFVNIRIKFSKILRQQNKIAFKRTCQKYEFDFLVRLRIPILLVPLLLQIAEGERSCDCVQFQLNFDFWFYSFSISDLFVHSRRGVEVRPDLQGTNQKPLVH